ncbi:MAG: hypothetical protein EBY24_22695 [Betaproteobacteria bacterium]|nr:hypothetical protein [Betaproteobacteria bacterium]
MPPVMGTCPWWCTPTNTGVLSLTWSVCQVCLTTTPAFATRKRARSMPRTWVALKLEAADIPVSPVNSIEDLFTDPHLNAVGLFSDMAHPTEGVLKVARFPVKFSRSPATIRRLAPTKGADTEAVIAESRARAARAGG